MDIIHRNGTDFEYHCCNTLVAGAGAAAYCAALRLSELGQHNILMLSEGSLMGTSRNTGSDKQTYYKLSSAPPGDNARAMAQTLFSGGATDGDTALCEAALSARCFYKLVELGVPFPHNRYGEYAGYRTDHDDTRRATSAGPLTSRYMTERLEECVHAAGVPMLEGCQVVAVLTDGAENAIGILALRLHADGPRFALVNAVNTVYATGGPAELYLHSVYPQSQHGAHGAAFEAGALGKNLTESQYGIASTSFRWNLSGSYQQALPAYISTGQNGGDERLFLNDYFDSAAQIQDCIFKKGYEWPFDPNKLSGSSLVDLAVSNETMAGRKVYLDYRINADGSPAPPDFSTLGGETRDYLSKSNALQALPIGRLKAMNEPAYQLYLDNGIDLAAQRLEIAVCAQHNNGGLSGSLWWESNLKHFFPVGEANGSHGVRRPGGSALNAGQAGALRAAQYIFHHYSDNPRSAEDFLSACGNAIDSKMELFCSFAAAKEKHTPVAEAQRLLQARMSDCAAHLRNEGKVSAALECARTQLMRLPQDTFAADICELSQAFRNYDSLVSQITYLSAIEDYIARGGVSRGSYLIEDENGRRMGGDPFYDKIQEVQYKPGGCAVFWRDARPLPEGEDWFETVWIGYLVGECYE